MTRRTHVWPPSYQDYQGYQGYWNYPFDPLHRVESKNDTRKYTEIQRYRDTEIHTRIERDVDASLLAGKKAGGNTKKKGTTE